MSKEYHSIEESLKKMKEQIKETYKTVGVVKTEEEKEKILKNFSDLYGMLASIHAESFKLDSCKVPVSLISRTEDDTFDELEKNYFEELKDNANYMQKLKVGFDGFNEKI